MGVKAVIAAGWAVDDAAALTFAETLLQHTARRRDLRRRGARRAGEATWAAHPGANTWGAYQCYGDPGFRLQRDDRRGAGRRRARTSSRRPNSSAELRNLAESGAHALARRQDDEAVAQWLRAGVDALLARVPAHEREKGREGWMGAPTSPPRIGFAYGEAKLFAEARAVARTTRCARRHGDCPVRAVEQCANFQVRLAAQAWAELRTAQRRQRRRDAGLARQQAELAEPHRGMPIRELDFINARSPNAERLALLGSACKRLAWVQTERAAARRGAAEHGAVLPPAPSTSRRQDRSYPLSNWAVACLLLEDIDPAYAQRRLARRARATCANARSS